ncbi:DnaT-like ssDNA-binding protein [uncultured Ruegeria sp.]|uniref:DnaT-like ssDNA-binding protein n=1 Tax=uncultured Ruegeria sp. TaxID=259304 RepID=UPI002638B3DF|nr:DnaT-like ssDNA-binding protein [uncultured Ruegeria sp.]
MALDTTIGGTASDSYATLAEYQTYAANMGWELPALHATQEAHLRRAAMINDAAYVWLGRRVTSTQALQWPRYIAQDVDGFPVASDAIPAPIKTAQMEMAYLLQQGDDPVSKVDGRTITSERKKVDVIETETQYSEGFAQASYPSVDRLVSTYSTGKLGQRAGSVPIMRA